ncbi:glycosyltransferase family 1 protein [Clostridium sp.]|uniref:glycosyltransferase family 1 protein n=1 Tax=Clostridium sp. TaxID=1506 RepID=UPI003990CA90
MIRILNVVYGMNRGGIETFIMNIYRKIDRNKIQFDFLLHTEEECDYNAEIKELGGKIFYVPQRNKGVLNNKRALNDFFKTHKEYNIVHQHVSSLTYIEPIIAAKRNGVPVRIIHGHNTKQTGSSVHKYLHYINKKRISQYATDYFACSKLAAEWMYGGVKNLNNKYKIINNSIDSKKFIFSQQIRDEMRKELGLENRFVVGHIGRFHKQKNHTFLIDIFSEIKKLDESAILLLVGDGKEKEKIIKYIEDKGLKQYVIFLGVRSDINKILQAMDSFVFPSLYEGLGIALIEAQAAGLKTYTSKDVVPNEVKITNLLNFISLEVDEKDWAKLILDNKEYKRNNMQEFIIKNNYDINESAKNIQSYYLNKENIKIDRK